MKITNKILSSIAGRSVNLSAGQIDSLNWTLDIFDISTPNRVAHFISQCCHESGRFRWFAELASGDAYENRKDLGNTSPGDGRRFKGAGAIQMTGRYWYGRFSDFSGDEKIMSGVDYVSAKYPFECSGFWWVANRMNDMCDSGASCAAISARVNGSSPARGLKEREEFFARAGKVLQAQKSTQAKQASSKKAHSIKYSIIAARSTTMKKQLKQSSMLPASQVVDVSAGHKYMVESLKEIEGTGHYLAKIAYGSGDWYIYAPHWNIKKEGSPVAKAAQSAKTAYRTAVRAMNISQPDAYTCQAACIGMAISDPDVRKIRAGLDRIAVEMSSRSRGVHSAGSTSVMGAYLKSKIGDRYEFDIDASLHEMKSWLQNGEFLITHGWFTGSGHVICLDGIEVDSRTMSFRFDVKDPWSEFNAPAWAYNINKNFYDGYYSSYCIYAACVASASVSDAARIYRSKQIDPSRRGAWVHRIKP